MNGIPSALFFVHSSSTSPSTKSSQRVKHYMGPTRVSGGYHLVVCIEKHFLNLHPPIPLLSLPSSIFAIPDHCSHRLCRLVAAAAVPHFTIGKMLRDHFMKPLQGSLLRKLRADILGIPDDAGGSVMFWREAIEKVIPIPQECVGRKSKYTGMGPCSYVQ